MRQSYWIILLIVLVSCSEQPRFRQVSARRTGIDFENTITETDSLHVMNFEYIYNGAGVGIADLNNDGLQDLLFTGNQVSSRIYLNQGKFRFRDISSSFEDLDNGQWYSGVAFVDINMDGWKDVYLTCTAYTTPAERKNRFFICQGLQENGELLYIDMAESYGLADDSYSVHASFFDYDLDGDLDLYLMNNFVNDRLSASYRPKVNDGSAVSNDDLYRNEGNGTFTNVTLEAGIIYEGFGLGLALGDVNRDGYPDLYISNDYISNDVLYINQQDGTFNNEIATYLSYQTKSSMGNDMADVNNDGNRDMFTLDMFPESYHKKKQTINGFAYLYYINDAKFGYEHQYLRNMLHLHNGFIDGKMLPYSEVGQLMGVYQTEWSWSPLFADYDNDGDKDLLITNGYPKDLTDKDWTNYKAEVYNFVASEQHLMDKAPAVKEANNAFENLDGERFVKRSDSWFEPTPSYSYGAAFGDLDNDGDLDYVVNNIDETAFVYRNTSREQGGEKTNYLRVHLVGEKPNTEAYGAKVELWSGGRYQYREQFLSRGYISSVDPVVHFGLGVETAVDSLKIAWPSGERMSVIRDIPANQILTVEEQEARDLLRAGFQPPAAVDPGSGAPRSAPARSGALFTNTDSLFRYLHQQEDFIDFYFTQKTIPHKFSQIGPRMLKGDLNGDTLPDIIVGATNCEPTRVYLNRGNGFEETAMKGLTFHKEFSESGFAILDTDRDGDRDVIALAGGYENREEQYIHYLYENTGGEFDRKPLPISTFPASVIRPCDFDHDGDTDLFIGARIKMEMFPFASDSWILVNDGGGYRAETAMSFNLGMVTDAVWSDYDGDGWEDLLIAREWNSITVIKNLKGQRLLSQDLPEIDTMHGIWYSITAGDFDGDGDADYILGNLGDNHRYTVSDRYPLRFYALDLDLNGTLDPISTGYWKNRQGTMTEFPVNYLDELVGQSRYFMQKFPSYESFSYAPFSEVLDTSMINRVQYTFHINTTSSYILWNEDGAFRWEKLPPELQVSPIKHSVVYDFNGDGLPDVLLAGNDHTYDVSTGYFDANKGPILMSRNGRPLNSVVPPSRSGILLNGMVESLLWFEGEEPMIVAGFNRDSARTFTLTGPEAD